MSASYRETISWLFSLQQFGIKLGLTTITRLLKLLGNPQGSLACIHIAGTNGKGSTAAFIHSIFCNAGYRPGLFTSPHLVDFAERIVVGAHPITHREVTNRVRQLRDLCRRHNIENVTFFEFVTALALTYFADQDAHPVILETGLGGRLDATNVIDPQISIITSISREHTAILGPTLMHITREKAGIIKPGRTCISAVTRPAPRDAIRQICNDNGAPLLEYGRDYIMRPEPGGYCYKGLERKYNGLQPGLAGRHQMRNAALAITAAELLRSRGYALHETAVSDGLKNCTWPGRLERVQGHPRNIVLDGAHNPAAWQALTRALNSEFTFRRLVLIIGVMRDKDMSAVRNLAAQAHLCIFFQPRIQRSASRAYLEKYIVFSDQKKVLWTDTCAQAIAAACVKTGPHDLICVTGSLFAVGEAREQLWRVSRSASGRIGL